MGRLQISSPDIRAFSPIAAQFTVDGGNRVPQLAATGVPSDAVELAVVMHDPDAPLPRGFTHWTLYGIPACDGVIDTEHARVGPNDAGNEAYMGPQPPVSHGRHHYYFWVYALDRRVEGAPDYDEFLRAYAANVLEQNRLVGYFQR